MNKVKANYTDSLAYYDLAYFLKKYINSTTVIVCIGTDRCIGDCLGPITGSMLKERRFPLPVYGTIQEPIHALNIDKKLEEIKKLHPGSSIIGIDACLGESENIGEIQVRDYPIHPGKGVGKSLPDVGDASIIGIIDSCESSELFTNRNIRLNLVIEMSKVIVHTLIHSYYLYSSETTIIKTKPPFRKKSNL
ncbi:MAG: spore protease YyaC [Bacillota bacterium]|nr:spore protease YyaC [Bacillota bacterium]